MPFGLSRRGLVGRILGTTAFGLASSGLAGSTATQAQDGTPAPRLPDPLPDPADAPGGPPWAVRLRQTVDRLQSAAGASLIGFRRSDSPSAARTVQGKLSEYPAITDFGAVGDDRFDNVTAIQQAIDAVHAAGGGALNVPAGRFRIGGRVQLRSNVTLQGAGAASVLHLVNTRRNDALRGDGQPSARLSRVAIRDLAIVGDARFSGGTPDVINGSGIIFVHADDCTVAGVIVTGFSDNGISFLNGSRNSVTQCQVDRTAQGISFTANTMTVHGNVAIGNRITDTGEYNALHLEGGFGGKDAGEVRHTTLSANTISGSWEAGINIELAPCTSCVGNTVDRSGLGRTAVAMGIKVYGGYRSAICGNTVTGGSGDGIVVGANSGECAIEGNVTAGNRGSLLLTDSGAQVSNDVAVGSNSFTEGDIRLEGNVRLRTRTFGLGFANRDSPDPQTLDWYEEGRFAPVVRGVGPARAARGVGEARFTRIGSIVQIVLAVEWTGAGVGEITVEGLPYPAAVETPLLATARRGAGGGAGVGGGVGGGGLDDRIDALASGRALVLRMAPGAARPGTGGDDRVRHVAIAGQYLTTG